MIKFRYNKVGRSYRVRLEMQKNDKDKKHIENVKKEGEYGSCTGISLMTLPEHFKECRLEVIVLPVEERVVTVKNESGIDRAITVKK